MGAEEKPQTLEEAIKALNEANNQKANLAAENNQLVEQKNQLAHENVKLGEDKASLENHIEYIQKQHSTELIELETRYKSIVSGQKKAVTDLEKELEEAKAAPQEQTEPTANAEVNKALVNEKTRLENEVSGLKDSNRGLLEELNRLQEDLNRLQEDYDSHATAFIAQQQSIPAKDKELADKNMELEAKNKELADKNTEIRDLVEQLTNANKELLNKDKDIEAKERQISGFDLSNATQSGQLSTKDTKIKDLEDKLEAKGKELADLHQNNSALLTENNTMRQNNIAIQSNGGGGGAGGGGYGGGGGGAGGGGYGGGGGGGGGAGGGEDWDPDANFGDMGTSGHFNAAPEAKVARMTDHKFSNLYLHRLTAAQMREGTLLSAHIDADLRIGLIKKDASGGFEPDQTRIKSGRIFNSRTLAHDVFFNIGRLTELLVNPDWTILALNAPPLEVRSDIERRLRLLPEIVWEDTLLYRFYKDVEGSLETAQTQVRVLRMITVPVVKHPFWISGLWTVSGDIVVWKTEFEQKTGGPPVNPDHLRTTHLKRDGEDVGGPRQTHKTTKKTEIIQPHKYPPEKDSEVSYFGSWASYLGSLFRYGETEMIKEPAKMRTTYTHIPLPPEGTELTEDERVAVVRYFQSMSVYVAAAYRLYHASQATSTYKDPRSLDQLRATMEAEVAKWKPMSERARGKRGSEWLFEEARKRTRDVNFDKRVFDPLSEI